MNRVSVRVTKNNLYKQVLITQEEIGFKQLELVSKIKTVMNIICLIYFISFT